MHQQPNLPRRILDFCFLCPLFHPRQHEVITAFKVFSKESFLLKPEPFSKPLSLVYSRLDGRLASDDPRSGYHRFKSILDRKNRPGAIVKKTMRREPGFSNICPQRKNTTEPDKTAILINKRYRAPIF